MTALETDEPDWAGLDRSELLEVFRALVLNRAAEERLDLLFKQGHIKGGVYRSLGQEACAVGAAYALRRRDDGTGDVVGQTVRATGAVFLMGGTPLDLFRQYLSRATGPTRGREANVHWSDFERGLVGPVSPLGVMAEVMAGVALAFKLRGEDRVGLVFGGDGQTSTGAWHEGVNLAAALRCPLVIAVEHNQWAFSTPTTKQTRLASFTEKAPGYGLWAESVDGNDVLAVFSAARRAIAHARSGAGPALLEMRTYRRLGHAQHDAQEYVAAEELASWAARDPIDRFRRRLEEHAGVAATELDAIVGAVESEVQDAAEQAVAEPSPTPNDALQDVYSGMDALLPWTRTPVAAAR
ncbi:MAG: thiamine pyrophosphate-dependent dehydrogenase E1 component subunit alpha [Gemmatimonadota bacterium]